MLSDYLLRPFSSRFFQTKRTGIWVFAGAVLFFSLFQVEQASAQTCIFDQFIRASDNPFGSCPPGVDTIIIRDSFAIDKDYEPIIGGVPFEGVLIVDGGVISWTSNAYLKLGYPAKVILINGGLFRPESSTAADCNGLRALYFDVKKVVNCNGIGAPHAFSDVNNAGCVTEIGICCNAFIIETDSSGNYNDLTLCQPGDTAHLSVISSGSLGYSYLWTPNIGPAGGIYPVAPQNNTVYTVSMSAIFNPYGGDPAYLLTCDGSVTIKINKPISVSAAATSVPCVGVPTGTVTLTVSGGTPPYSYIWSNGATTKNLTNVAGGKYTVTVKDAKGCAETLSVQVPVEDNIPPTISCPANATGIADLNACTTLIPNIDAVYSDNCPTVGVTYALSGATTGSGSGQLSNVVPFYSGVTIATYTVDDGTTAKSCTFQVTVNDTQHPTASNPAPITGISCLAGVPAPDPTVVTDEADNCGPPQVTHIADVTASGGGCPGDTLVILRSYRVSDAAGNSITVTQTIRVVDNQPPSFTFVPGNIMVNCQSIPAVGAPTAVDNCGGSVNITYNGETRVDGPCVDNYTLLRRWTASDNCGNTATAEQAITVHDITPPAFTFVPANSTVSCDAIPAVGTPAATDNCDMGVNIVYDGQTRTDGACPDSYTLRRRWTASDNCGNTATAEQVIVVQDVTKPVFTSVPADATVSCDAIPAVGVPAATDNCDAVVAISYDGQTRTDGACPYFYTLRRRWTASDNCGNTTTAEQLITVRDNTKPVFTFVPSDVTVSCETIPALGNPVAADNCSSTAPVTFLEELRTNGACTDSYTLQRRWMATDDCGNTALATQIITVQDITAPVYTSVPANATVSCDAIPPVGTPTASDNCALAVVINYDGQVRTDGPCPDNYTLTRRWTATDNCGNTRSTVQIITVQDTTKPVFTSVPADVTVSCDAIPAVGIPAATDNCDGSVAISYNGETRINGNCSDNYTLTRQWTAADNCGNTASAVQNIVVRDLTPPFFTFVPPDATVNCEAIPSLGSPTAADNCDNSVTITFAGVTQNSGSCASGGTVSRHWIAEDNCGNTAMAEQMLTVQDTTRPVFTLVLPNITVSCEAIPAPGTPEATDNCTATVDIVYNGQVRTDGPCADTYTLTRNWTAIDLCGNTATTQQKITVRDQTAPVFTFVPAHITVNCDNVPAPGTPSATDNCDADVQLTYNGEVRTNGACPDTYSLIRRWTATDNCGNTTSATQSITVQDVTKPVFTFVPADATVTCEAVPALQTPTAADNCTANVILTYNGETRENGPCPDTYVLKRQWTIADNCGNTDSAVQVITVQDLTKPVFTFVPADVTVSCEAVPAVQTPTATDNCAANVTVSYNGETREDGACTNTYVLKRRWTIADNCGNTDSAVQVITVQDLTKPVFTFIPADVTVSCEAVPAVESPAATDNCTSSVAISYNGETREDGACPNTYLLKRRWTIADECGNTDAALQVITVQDLTKPVFTYVPADVTVSCAAIPALDIPLASDNCDASVAITYDGETRVDGSCPDTYTLTRRWTAADDCGNATQAEQVITVRDTEGPVFILVPANTTVSCESVPPVDTPTASDNCSANVQIAYDGEVRTDGACPNSYALLRKWTATDNCGNTTTATQEILVQDTTQPDFTYMPADVTVSCENVPAVEPPTATDNCTADVIVSFNGETREDGPCPHTYILRRQWTIADQCANSRSAVQVITVLDETKPVFTFFPADATVTCESVPALETPTATDNCTAGVSVTYNGETREDGPCIDTYVLKRQWTIADDCGNTDSAIQTITVRDDTKPVFTFVPANTTVDCDQVPALEIPTATDNCAANALITYDGETRTDGPCPDTYTLTRRWTATDNCGNFETAEQVIKVEDTTRPFFTFVPADVTVTCESVPAVDNPAASDNCDGAVEITYDGEERVDGACPDTYTLIRRWTVSDNCGNTEKAEQQITVQDLTKPVFSFVPADITVDCDTVPSVGQPLATDNCTADVLIVFDSETRTDGSCPFNYTLLRRWIASDNCGNTAEAEQLLTVRDTTKPEFTFVPADLTVDCQAVPPVGIPTATDNCAPGVTITYEGEERLDGACSDTYTLIRRWKANDACGNVSLAEQTIQVQDTTKPAFTFIPPNITVNCDAVPAVGVPTATDNCTGVVAISFDGETRTNGTCPDNYTLLRRWTAADNCGNAVTAEQLISVQDTTKPVFTYVPADATVNCESIPSMGTPIATDNCDQSLTISVSSELLTGGDCSSGGMLIRRWVATDNCGNSVMAEQNLTVQDTTRPVFTFIPANVTVTCEAVPGLETPTAADNCTVNVSIQYNGEERIDGPCPDTYILRRRWTAEDICGNAQTALQVITVQDLTPPVLTYIPANVTVACESVPPVDTPTATDNCDADVSITFDGETRIDGACPDSYTLQRRWTATDNCGNSVTAEQVIVVQDLTPPVFTFSPPSLTSSCAGVPPVGTPTATDNCDADVAITFDGETRTDGACPDSYTLRRQWTATDNCGNAVSTEQIITVQDITPPTFTFVPASATVSCDAVPALANPIAEDNCTVAVTVTFNGEVRTDGACPDTYTLRRSWTASDNCGNTKTAEQILTVQDITAPVFTFAPADTVVSCDALPQPALPIAVDNCDAGVQIIYEGESIISSSSVTTYVLQRKWTAVDNCGNTTEAIQLLSVLDTVAPVIICPPNVQVDNQLDLCSAKATFEAPFSSDNCTLAPAITGTDTSGTVFPIGTSIVVLQAQDESGNTATCSFAIVVADTTAPVLQNCPVDFTVTTLDTGCEALVEWTAPTAKDACDDYLITPVANMQPSTMFPTGFTTVVYTAQDTSGNTATCSFTVTVNETIPPVLANCPTDIQLYTGDCTATANWIPPVATDNCKLDTLTSNFQPGTVFPETTTTVTYTAVDVWGNSTSCSFNVMVQDTVAPQFSGCPPDIVVNSNGACEIAVDWQLPTASDNCNPDPLIYAVPNPGDLYPVGFTHVKVIVEDPSGNTDTCLFKVTVIGPPLGFDNTPADQSFIGCSAIATWTPPVPTGVCGPITLESTAMPGDTFPVGDNVVVYTVTDTLGYSATTSFTISVTESIPPQFNCPASPVLVDISGAVLTDAGSFILSTDTVSTCDGVELEFNLPEASDNCGATVVEQLSGQTTGRFFEIGLHTLEFLATDDAGNTDMCSVEIEVLPLNPLGPQISDKIGCEGDDITLSTPVIPGASYIWNGPKAPYPDANNLLIEDLKPGLTGIYTVQARVNGCLTPLDSALVRQAILPDAIDDLDFEVETGGFLDSIDVVLNDILEYDDYTVTLMSQLPGLTQTGNGLFSYQAGPNNGHVTFIYKLCSEACPDLCDQAVVMITVRETFCTYIPNIITPNDDGINDYLEIPCLETELYPQNRLIIYNQWGDKVYEAAPYINTPDKAWRGTLDGQPGRNLPDGTYFYYFQPDPNKAALSGFIEIFR